MDSQPKTLVRAEFTRDMVETLRQCFDDYQVNGVVRIDVTDKGLWLPVPGDGAQKFLGSAKLIDQPAKFH